MAVIRKRPHESFTDIIACIIVLTGEILLTNMVKDIIDTILFNRTAAIDDSPFSPPFTF